MIAAAKGSFLEQIGPTLVAVILTGIVGLASAWAGRLWERRANHESWLRDQRLDVWNELLSACIEYSLLLSETEIIMKRRLNGDKASDEEAQQIVDGLKEVPRRVTDAATRAQLLGPVSVVELATACLDVLLANPGPMDEALDGDLSPETRDELKAVRDAFAQEASKFVALTNR